MRNEKPELSKKNPYYLTKHRYYELKHFCLQYRDWKRALTLLDGWQGRDGLGENRKGNLPSDPTEKTAIMRTYYSRKIDILDRCIDQLEPAIAPYVRMGVTEGISYSKLQARGCPCGSEMYYDIYRRFFWLLDRERG